MLPPDASTTGDDARVVAEWVSRIALAFKNSEESLEDGYMSLTPPEDCDALAFFGAETVERLKVVKRRYNPSNAFHGAYPVLE